MNNTKLVDSITIGFALFAMFFGAGNLILPPILGLASSSSWFSSIIGFAITGVMATFIGILAVVVSGDNFSDVGDRINPIFSIIITFICIISIGPLIAIPRTAATTFEIGVRELSPGTSPVLSSIIFFSITLILSISSSKVVNIIGKYLTPTLLIILLGLIFKGVFSPLNPSLEVTYTNLEAFTNGFREGYQTMDLLASFIMAGIIIAAIRGKGYSKEEEKKQVTIYSGLIAMAALILIYGGLVYLGATSGYELTGTDDRTQLLLHISKGLLGSWGTTLLAICVALACLTTAIALTSASADYFSNLTKGRISYKAFVVIVCLIGGYLAVQGVDNILQVAFPFLAVIYPITVCMAIYIVIFGKRIKSKAPYIVAILITSIIALMGLFVNLDIQAETFGNLLAKFPLQAYEIPWLIPSFIGFIITHFITKNK